MRLEEARQVAAILRRALEYVDIQGQSGGLYFGGAADIMKEGNRLLRRLGEKPVKMTAQEITADLEVSER